MYQTVYHPDAKIWNGPKKFKKNKPDLSVGETILKSLDKNLNKIGQINDDSDIALSNNEIKSRSIRIAQKLIGCGFKKGDTMGLVCRNGTNVAPTVFAGLLLGLQVNPLDTYFAKDDISRIFGLTKPKLILCDADLFNIVQDSVKAINLHPKFISLDQRINGISFIEDFFEETGVEHLFIPTKIDNESEEIAVILCSSGTTGLSKGIALSHAQILGCLSDTWEMMNDEILLCFSSLYWLSGTGCLIFGTLRGATRIITKERFNPELFLKIIEKYKVTYVLSPPSHLALSLQCTKIHTTDFSSIKSYMCGGSPVSIHIQTEFEKFLINGRILCGYGMTELGGFVTVNDSKEKIGSVGQLCKNVYIKVTDEYGNNLGPRESGELLLKNGHPFIGYYGNPEQTQLTKDSDGWIHSGDIGYFDDDGFVFLVDRKKDILKYQNYQVSPVDIENMIGQHEGVGLVCVVGIPDIIATDLPAALIVRANNQKGQDLNEKHIYDLIADNCADYKKLRGGVYFVDSLPMTPSGKFIKKKAKQNAIQLFNKVNILKN